MMPLPPGVPPNPGGQNPPSHTTGSTSSSSSSSSSTSAAAAKAKAQARADKIASLQNMLALWGIGTDGNINNLIQNAAKNNWNTDLFMQHLVHTKEFHKEFPGILNHQGRLTMSPTTYISKKNSIANSAIQAGLNLSPKQLTRMMVNHVNPAVASQRFSVEASIQNNADSFAAFNQELKAMGHKPLTKKGMVQFVTGQAPAGFYNLYHNFQSRLAAQNAGFALATPVKNKKGKVIGYQNNLSTDDQNYLTRQEQVKLGRSGFSQDQLSGGLQKLAADFRSAYPESQRQNMGITHDDLVQLEFGGTRQAAVQKKVEQILNNAQAKAGQNFAGTQTNLGGRGGTSGR